MVQLDGTEPQRMAALRLLRASLRAGLEGGRLTDRLSDLSRSATDATLRSNLARLSVMTFAGSNMLERRNTADLLVRFTPTSITQTTAAGSNSSGHSAAVSHTPARDTRPPRRNRRRR